MAGKFTIIAGTPSDELSRSLAAGTSIKITWLMDLSSSTDYYEDMKERKHDLATTLIVNQQLRQTAEAYTNGTERTITDKDRLIQSSDIEPDMIRSVSAKFPAEAWKNRLANDPTDHGKKSYHEPDLLTIRLANDLTDQGKESYHRARPATNHFAR